MDNLPAIPIKFEKDNPPNSYAAVSFAKTLLIEMAAHHRKLGNDITNFIEEVERCCNAALDPTDAAATQHIKNVCTQIWEATTP